MKTKNDRFLVQGIRCYAEARDTVIAFEAGIGSVLEKAVKRRKDWNPLSDVKFGKLDVSENDYNGHWISFWISGTAPESGEAVIDCGFWWKCGSVDFPIIYASYFDKPESVMGFAWEKNGGDIDSFSAWGRTFLFVRLQKPTTIDEQLDRLFVALLKQVK